MSSPESHAERHSAPTSLRPYGRGATALTVMLIVGLIGLLWLRMRTPQTPLVIALVGFAPFGLVAAALTVVTAWWSGRRALVAAAVATAVAFTAVVAPHGVIGGCTASTGEGDVRILTANIETGGAEPEAIAALVAAHQPDIVVLEEVERSILRSLESNAEFSRYSHRSDIAGQTFLSVVVWSRWPIESESIQRFSGAPLLHTEIATPAGTITVSGLHTTSPDLRGFVPAWIEQLATLAALDTATPRILVGDFNATADHRPFRELLSSGWTDAYDARGCGLDATWPARVLPFAFYRLDHVLVTDHLQVDSIQVAALPGSDHKPLVVTVHLVEDET